MYLFEAEKLHPDKKEMRIVRGKGNHLGSAIGKITFLSQREQLTAKTKSKAKSRDEESERYFEARRVASAELRRLYGELRSQCDAAWIFLMQLTLLDDELFSTLPKLYLAEGKSAEETTRLCRDYFFSSLCQGAGGENLVSVSLDIDDVALRIIKALGNDARLPTISNQSIILSHFPLPSYIAENRSSISGIVSSSLSKNSSIHELALALDIPYIYTDEDISESLSDKNALVDSTKGYLYIDPDISTLTSFTDQSESRRTAQKSDFPLAQDTTTAQELKKINILAEIDTAVDVKKLRPFICDGIGRFSSEELYLSEMKSPDEELLFDEYRKLAETMQTKPVIIRAFNTFGSVYLNSMISQDDDDVHGELYVTYDGTLHTQLRAVMRAAAYGNLSFALHSTKRYSDLITCASLIEEISSELYEEEREFNPVTLGAMISSPSSAIMCDKLLDECDFLIIEKEKLAESLSKDNNELAPEEDSICFNALCTLLEKIQKSAKKKKKKIILSLGKSGSIDGIPQPLLEEFSDISAGIDSLASLKKALIENQKG